MRFVKLHGAGNDYLVIDARDLEADWSALAVAMSHRHFGAGSDGIILVLPSRVADVRMRIFNPDGSEAEMSGNGIRCLAKFVVERGIAPLRDGVLRVETPAGVRTVEPLLEGGRVVGARVAMGVPRFHPQEVPVNVAWRLAQLGASPITGQRQGEGGPEFFHPGDTMVLDWPLVVEGRLLKVTALSMGNPQAVAFLDEPVESFPLDRLGPQVEHHPLFPQRVNFEVANVLNRRRIKARIWERGAGETLASGTGASAVAVAARLHGYVDETVEVIVPGGILTISWDGQGPVVLEGPVEEVYEGLWRKPL